jgi:DNA-binding CsgD family transcriptional regulator
VRLTSFRKTPRERQPPGWYCNGTRLRVVVGGLGGGSGSRGLGAVVLGASPTTVHLAHTHLVYGEWLRRENRRFDVREQLRTAYEMLDRFGAEAFAERARHELLATGESVRQRAVEVRQVLTAQEAQIARLASDGKTNSEIGAELFISPRTVEWHLGKVFTKLDVDSRNKLRGALAGA